MNPLPGVISGILIGWFADDIIIWIKSKRSVKGAPRNQKRKSGKDA